MTERRSGTGDSNIIQLDSRRPRRKLAPKTIHTPSKEITRQTEEMLDQEARKFGIRKWDNFLGASPEQLADNPELRVLTKMEHLLRLAGGEPDSHND